MTRKRLAALALVLGLAASIAGATPAAADHEGPFVCVNTNDEPFFCVWVG